MPWSFRNTKRWAFYSRGRLFIRSELLRKYCKTTGVYTKGDRYWNGHFLPRASSFTALEPSYMKNLVLILVSWLGRGLRRCLWNAQAWGEKHLPKSDSNDFFWELTLLNVSYLDHAGGFPTRARNQTGSIQEAVRHVRWTILECERQGYITRDHTEEHHTVWQFLYLVFFFLITSADTRGNRDKVCNGCEF